MSELDELERAAKKADSEELRLVLSTPDTLLPFIADVRRLVEAAKAAVSWVYTDTTMGKDAERELYLALEPFVHK